MTSWKITLPCNKAEAEAVEINDTFAEWETPPVLMASEPDEDKPNEWQIMAYTEAAPSAALLASLRALAPSSAQITPQVEQLADQDWVTLSQSGIEPITAGRFYVRTPHYPPMEGKVDYVIDAGLAFGTGHHATTSGCLIALDSLGVAGALFDNILDLGTGTGLLAFAALHLWPSARVTASDIDPVSITVTAENAGINDVPLGDMNGAVALVVADGMDAPALIDRAPFDLIVANVLARPLIEMAAAIAAQVADGGWLVLSGILGVQSASVAQAYEAQGLALDTATDHGDWVVLRLRRPV